MLLVVHDTDESALLQKLVLIMSYVWLYTNNSEQ